jgi:plastocyanin
MPFGRRFAAVLAAPALLTLCALAAPAAPARAASGDVTITDASNLCSSQTPTGKNYSFNPCTFNAAVGAPVVWASNSSTYHSITRCTPSACGGQQDTGADNWSGQDNCNSATGKGCVAPGATYNNTFTSPGTYLYYCTVHGYSAMHGEIVVFAPSPTPTPAAPSP